MGRDPTAPIAVTVALSSRSCHATPPCTPRAQATADFWKANPVKGTVPEAVVGFDRRFLSAEAPQPGDPVALGGLSPAELAALGGTDVPGTEGDMVRFAESVRRTLRSELAANPKVVVFGEDVGVKGGVHLVTEGLQKQFGAQRVFDTSLSEEGIIGRAVAMAISGLMPVAEIQFRKYADPATEQLNNCGTMRWRTPFGSRIFMWMKLPTRSSC